MKQITYLIVILLLCACQPNRNTNYRQAYANSQVSDGQYSMPEPHTYDFPEYGFSITAPCVFEDAPAQTRDKNLVNVGGFVNKGDRQNFTFYQLIVTEIRNKTEAEVLEFMKNRQGGMNNFRQTKINGYNSIEGDAVTQGVNTKGAFIIKSPYLIALTVISPINLEQKYDDFKNSFKNIGETSSLIEDEQTVQTNDATNSHAQLLDELIEKFGRNVGRKFSDAKKSAEHEQLTQFMEQQCNGYTATLFENSIPNIIVGIVHKKNIVQFVGIGFNSKPAMNAIFAELRTKAEYVGRSFYPLQEPKIEYPTYKYNGYFFQKYETNQGSMVIISKSVEMAD